MEKRRSNRIKHRLTCELVVGQQVYSAVVRDLGQTGLFVQTRARPNANSIIDIRFPASAGLPGFRVEAGVARQRNVHPRLQGEIQSGIGLEILGRSADYLAYVKRVGEPKTGGASCTAATSRPSATATPASVGMRPLPASTPASVESSRFRVHLSALGGSAPRTILIRAASMAAARDQALTRTGPGWKVTYVETT